MNEWYGKHVAVIGLGISNLSLIRFLQAKGAVISGRDQKSAAALGERFEELRRLGITLCLGREYLCDLSHFDTIFLTPGIPKDLPAIKALQGKVPIASEVSLVLAYAKGPVYGITGSSGKTTTTTLVGEMLKTAGLDVYVGGNIGVPLIEQVATISERAKIVLELSSFQLELLTQSPHGAMVTNITENHLDIHRTMENYTRAKRQIYRFQRPDDVAVFNADNATTAAMAAECSSEVFLFSRRKPVIQGAYLKGEWLTYIEEGQETPIVARSDLQLVGDHNVENMLAACVFAHLAGADWDSIRQTARNFAGVAHRLQKIAQKSGVAYFNDSIATTPSRAIAGIRSFSEPLVLIAGGYDKHLSFGEFAEVVRERVDHLVVMGATADKIIAAVEAQAGRTTPHIHRVSGLDEAVVTAARQATPGSVVLLSPACASFDMFPNYQERGTKFAACVEQLEDGGEP